VTFEAIVLLGPLAEQRLGCGRLVYNEVAGLL